MKKEKELWSILEGLLKNLELSETEIAKIREDLEVLVKAELVITILEKVPKEELRSAEKGWMDKEEGERAVAISDFIKSKFETEEIERQIAEVTGNIFRDYLEDLYESLDDEEKLRMISAVAEQI